MLNELTKDQILCLAFIGAHTAGIAHNINTPLTAIMGRMELLQMRLKKFRGSVPAADLDKCYRDLATASQCCAKIDDALKNSVATSSGILKSASSEARLDALLKSVLAFLNADMEFKHRTVKSFDFQDDIPPIVADPVAFTLAFLEILYNSRIAMLQAAEKKLSIRMTADGGAITIEFRDSGCGMEESRRRELIDLLRSGREAAGRESGLQRVARLLGPYGVTYDIRSRPGETVFALRVPVSGAA